MNESIELKVAKKAATSAGQILRQFGGNFQIRYKEIKDIVTEADIASQSEIINIIKVSFPGDGILAEELNQPHPISKRLWIIDPLDGTVNFANGIPLYGVSIALVENGDIRVGVIYLPLFDELYYAEKGKGSFCNGEKIQVSDNKIMSKAIVNFNDFNIGPSARIDLLNKAKVRLVNSLHGNSMRLKNFSSAVLEFAYVAIGRLDAYFMIYCGFWDIAAGVLLVEEAGGLATGFFGETVGIGTKLVIASNRALNRKYINLINQDKEFKQMLEAIQNSSK